MSRLMIALLLLLPIVSSTCCVGTFAQTVFDPGQFRGGFSIPLTNGLAGGQEADETQNEWTRARSFDYESTYISLLLAANQNRDVLFEPLKELRLEGRKALDNAIDVRLQAFHENRKVFDPMLAHRRLQALNDQPAESQAILRKLFNFSDSASEPTLAEQNEALLQYKRWELEAEREFAEKVFEILTPEFQFAWFRIFAKRGSQFLVHPFGVEYLGLTEPQAREVKRNLHDEIATRTEIIRGVLLKNSEFFNASLAEQQKAFSDSQKDLITRKQLNTLAGLSREQLTKFLQLKGDISSTGSIAGWIEEKPVEQQTIAREVLRDQLRETES